MADAIAKVKRAMEALDKTRSDKDATPVSDGVPSIAISSSSPAIASSIGGPSATMKAPVLPTASTVREPTAVALAKFVSTIKTQLEQAKQQHDQMIQQLEILKMNIKKFEGALETCEVVSKML